jgi:hypothetical protein
MKKTVKHLSDSSLLALYLALRAARKGTDRVVILNQALKRHLGQEKVHTSRIRNFADTLKPVFPRHSMGKEHYGLKNCLFLYLNEKQDESVKTKPERINSIPNQATIDKEMGIQLVEL